MYALSNKLKIHNVFTKNWTLGKMFLSELLIALSDEI